MTTPKTEIGFPASKTIKRPRIPAPASHHDKRMRRKSIVFHSHKIEIPKMEGEKVMRDVDAHGEETFSKVKKGWMHFWPVMKNLCFGERMKTPC